MKLPGEHKSYRQSDILPENTVGQYRIIIPEEPAAIHMMFSISAKLIDDLAIRNGPSRAGQHSPCTSGIKFAGRKSPGEFSKQGLRWFFICSLGWHGWSPRHKSIIISAPLGTDIIQPAPIIIRPTVLIWNSPWPSHPV